MADIVTMTADAIRKRLDEITVADRTFAARDLDAEMSAVMRAGGDVDAMEAKILDAERLSRRLRAERAALEGELPVAVKREGGSTLDTMAKRHDEAAGEIAPVIDRLCETWDAFKASVQDWQKIQAEVMGMTERAETIVRESAAPMPSLGNFRSARVAAIVSELFEGSTWSPITMATREMQVGWQVQSRVID